MKQLVGLFFNFLFGSLKWNPPIWMIHLKNAFAKQSHKATAWFRRDPKRGSLILGGSLVSLLILIGGGVWLYRYYDSLPKPQLVKISVRKPQPTNPDDNIVNSLNVTFSYDVARLEDLDKPLSKGIEMKPEIKGTWAWKTPRALEFKPSGGDWEIGQEYRIRFDKKLFADHVKLEKYQQEFTTDALSFSFYRSEFYMDPRDPKVKKVVATLHFNYPVNAEDLKKRIELTYQPVDSSVLGKSARSYPYGVSFNKIFTEAYITSDNISIPAENYQMVVKANKGLRAARGGPASTAEAERKVTVPGLYEGFQIESSEITYVRNEKYEPEQILMVHTSSEIASEEVAKQLKLRLLPKDFKPPGATKVIKNYEWQSISELDGDVAGQSTEVPWTLIPTENAISNLHSFRISTDVNRSLFVTIEKPLKSFGGYELKEKYENLVRIGDYPRELMFMSEGAILSMGGDKKLPMLARNVNEVKFEIGRVIPDQVNHVLEKMLSDKFSRPYLGHLKELVTERFEQKQKLSIKSAVATQYFSLDLENYLNKGGAQKGLFFITVTTDTGERAERLILVTDLGAVAKNTISGKTEVFVQNFRTGLPVDGASVSVMGLNGISLFDLTTSARGSVTVPDLKEFKREKEPTAFVIKKGNDVSYLPYKLYDRELQYSRFDVGGVFESNSSDQLKSMLFSDRGIYRPGETINVGLIVRSKNWRKSFSKVPLRWSVTDPRGQEVLNEKIEVNSGDLKSLNLTTRETWSTGLYDVRVFLTKKDKYDEEIGQLNVRVEEFMPDRLRISTTLQPEKLDGWIAPGEVLGNVTLKNMFGTSAEGRKVRGVINLIPVAPQIKNFAEYNFANPNRKDAQVYNETLPELTTDGEGHAVFKMDLGKYEGLFRLRFDAEGFESAGGRSVMSSSTVLISSFPYLIGYKSDGDLTYISKNAERKVSLVAIDSNHKKQAASKVQLSLIERKYVSSLMKQSDGTYKYQSVKKEISLNEKTVDIPAAGLDLALPSAQAGDYTYVIKTDKGQEVNRFDFTVIGEANISRSLEKNAELQITLNKKDYKPGDEIEMQIKAPYKGAGLITIERDEVYAFVWFKASGNSSVEKIKIPEGLEGNAYVNVTFLRSIDAKEIFMSPLSYAVAPFSISLDQHKTKISLNAPDRVRPGEKLRIKYSSDRKTDLILYGVDEGILQVAKYKLPDPLNFFFQKRALQVKTYQLLDLLMPEFSLLTETSAAGGDEGFGAIGKNLNPFKRKGQKPVVFWSGVIKADEKSREYVYDVPDYFNGNIKIMAITSAQLGLGAQSVATLVRGDFIVTPSVPLFVAPLDQFTIGLGVANQLEGSGEKAQIQMDIATSDQVEVVGSKKIQLDIPEGREKSTDIQMKALERLGSAKITFTASSGKKSAKSSIDLSVRPAVPYETTFTAGMTDKSPIQLNLARNIYANFSKQNFSVSPAPQVLSFGLLSYLEDFTYGCTEQLVSKAMPAMILRGRAEFAIDLKKAGEAFKGAIEMLRTRQTSSGGFALYNPSLQATAIPQVSLYAAQYLTEAKDKGYAVPADMLERTLAYLRSSELRRTETLAAARMLSQALYLQARNGIVPSRDLNFLREALEKNHKGEWEQDVTAVYLAGTYKLLKQDDEGKKIVSALRMGAFDKIDYDFFQDSLSRDAIVVTIVAKHFPDQLKGLLTEAGMKSLIEPILNGQYNTYSSAQVLNAFDALLSSVNKEEFLKNLHVEELQKGGGSLSIPIGDSLMPKWNLSEKAEKVLATGNWTQPVFYSLVQAGYDRALPSKEIKNKMELSREYKVNGAAVSKVKLGDEVTVSLRLRALEANTYRNIALVDLLPGGFEIVLDSHSQAPSSTSSPDAYNEENGELPPQEDNGGEGDGDYNSETSPEDGASFFWRKILGAPAYAQTTSMTPLWTDYVDYREDRVVVYATATDQVREFTYKIKAVNRGTYVVPPAFAESMYDRAVKYRGVSGQIVVE